MEIFNSDEFHQDGFPGDITCIVFSWIIELVSDTMNMQILLYRRCFLEMYDIIVGCHGDEALARSHVHK